MTYTWHLAQCAGDQLESALNQLESGWEIFSVLFDTNPDEPEPFKIICRREV